MTDITIDKQPTRRSDFSRLFTVLRSPTATFTEMISEARSTWLTPMLVLQPHGGVGGDRIGLPEDPRQP